MALDRILFPEFREQFAPTRYPFTDSSSLRTATGLTFESAAILDASLYCRHQRGPLFLSAVQAAPRQVSFLLGDAFTPDLATARFDPLAAPEVLAFQDALGRPAGLFVCDPILLATFQTYPAGSHTLGPLAAMLVPSTVIPVPAGGIEGVLLEDGTLLTGDVWLVGEDGVVLSEAEPGTVRVDVVGDPLFLRAQCNPEGLFQTPAFLATINRIAPDSQGHFQLTVGTNLASDPVLRVTPRGGALVIEAVGKSVAGS